MNHAPQIIELADGTKCVALEDYDTLAVENMLDVNKLCNQRDAAIKELKEAWLAMDEIEGTDRINEWQNKNAHFLNTDT
jgi:ankyrin repeat protein